MRKMQRIAMTVMGTVALTTGLAVSTALPAAAYAPGSATPFRPVYNADTGYFSFHCNFTHWRSGAKVTWHCNLLERPTDDPTAYIGVQYHTGSWTPGPTSLSVGNYKYRYVITEGQLCTQAYALSSDGGTSPNHLACS
jgi:hypothetical protein